MESNTLPTSTDASAEPTTKLTRRDITPLGFRSALLQAGFNYERMQATCFASAQVPLLNENLWQ